MVLCSLRAIGFAAFLLSEAAEESAVRWAFCPLIISLMFQKVPGTAGRLAGYDRMTVLLSAVASLAIFYIESFEAWSEASRQSAALQGSWSTRCRLQHCVCNH